MTQCGICGAPATRSCTSCGKFCCESHITRFHAVQHAGAVCSDCASNSWILTLVGLGIFAVIGSVIYFTVIQPQNEAWEKRSREHQQEMNRMQQDHDRMKREGEQFRQQHGFGR